MAIQAAMTFEHQPSHRTKIVAFRLTPDDYERLNALAHARGMQIGEWRREISLKFSRSPEGDSFQQAITGEMIALKDLVMDVTYNFASGCRITPNVMTDIWKEAERTKRTKCLQFSLCHNALHTYVRAARRFEAAERPAP